MVPPASVIAAYFCINAADLGIIAINFCDSSVVAVPVTIMSLATSRKPGGKVLTVLANASPAAALMLATLPWNCASFNNFARASS